MRTLKTKEIEKLAEEFFPDDGIGDGRSRGQSLRRHGYFHGYKEAMKTYKVKQPTASF